MSDEIHLPPGIEIRPPEVDEARGAAAMEWRLVGETAEGEQLWIKVEVPT